MAVRRLPFELRRQIVAFLTSIPNMQNHTAQQALINSLEFDAQLQHRIEMGGSSKEFFETLVETLEGCGKLEDGRDPLIEELRTIEIAAPPRYNAPSSDTKDHTASDTFIQFLRPREVLKT